MKRFWMICLCLPLLTSCETFNAAKRDLGNMIGGSSDAAANTPAMAHADGPVPCPSIAIMDDLRVSVEFKDPEKPSANSEIGRLTMQEINAECAQTQGQLAAKIAINFGGTVGPKARWKAGDELSFAYPYFIAVTDGQGLVVSKEIFAASVSFGGKENTIAQVETIHQNMPMDGKKYNVILGFQLSDEQLAYNRAHAVVAKK